MHKIDSVGATQDNKFTEGDVRKRIPATELSAEWFNAVQDELVNIVGDSNLNKSDNTQIATVINIIKNNINDLYNRLKNQDLVGKINIRSCNASSLSDIAKNEIHADGQEISRDEYTELWQYALQAGRLIDDSDWIADPHLQFNFSYGNGSTTFRVPKLSTADVLK